MDPFAILLVFCGLFVGWTMGANDAGNCMGAAVGSGMLTYKKALYLVGIFAVIGAVVSGEKTIYTVGDSLVRLDNIASVDIAITLFSAAIVIAIMTFFAVPISTTQAVLGSIAALGIVLGATVQWEELTLIFTLGFVTPLAAFIVSYIFQRWIMPLLLQQDTFLSQERFLKIGVLASGVFLAFTLGANHVGNVVGLAVGKGVLTPLLGGVLGGFAIAAGSATWGKNVMRTVAHEITSLDATMALSAQIGAGSVMFALTQFGIPTSFTFALVGAIAGVGSTKGMHSIDSKMLWFIFTAWILTPILSILLTLALLELHKIMI